MRDKISGCASGRQVSSWEPGACIAKPSRRKAILGLASQLSDHNFTEDNVTLLLGAGDATELLGDSVLYSLLSAGHLPDLLETAPGVLAQLFIRNGSVSAERYMQLLSPRLRRDLETVGIIAPDRNGVVSRVSISPCFCMYLISDQIFRIDGHALRPGPIHDADFVMPPHYSSFLMLRHVQRLGGLLLDMGCGSGVLSLVLSGSYQRVTGIDINPRAVAYSQINSLINYRNIRFYQQDLRTVGQGALRADHVIFNAPLSRAAVAPNEADWLTPRRIFDVFMNRVPQILRQGGLGEVFLLVEVPEGYPDASAVVQEWAAASRSVVCDLRVLEIPDTAICVPPTATEIGRLPPGNLLVDNEHEAAAMTAYLTAHRIREIKPVIASLRA